MTWRGFYVERADPDIKGYEIGSISRNNLINRYKWVNTFVKGITLDIPAGMGWGTSLLTNASVLIGIDNSEEGIKRGRELYSNLILCKGNMLEIPLRDDSIDTIVCCEGYEHITRKNQFKLIRELYRVIKATGDLLMTIPPKGHSGGRNEYHLYEPTIEEIEETLIGKFKTIEMIETNVLRYRLQPMKNGI